MSKKQSIFEYLEQRARIYGSIKKHDPLTAAFIESLPQKNPVEIREEIIREYRSRGGNISDYQKNLSLEFLRDQYLRAQSIARSHLKRIEKGEGQLESNLEIIFDSTQRATRAAQVAREISPEENLLVLGISWERVFESLRKLKQSWNFFKKYAI
jgi:hypothetical protein